MALVTQQIDAFIGWGSTELNISIDDIISLRFEGFF